MIFGTLPLSIKGRYGSAIFSGSLTWVGFSASLETDG
jgi:hypothetical protein